MKYEIQNVVPLLTATPAVAGAAVKILLLGGSILKPDVMQQASGCSAFIWRESSREIIMLVKALEV